MKELPDPGNPAWFFIWILFYWMFICCLISFFGGWWKLSRYYQSGRTVIKKRWRFQTAAMRRMTGYGSCINIGITEKGLYLSILFLFRAGHPPLLIPWEDIQIEKHQSRFMKGVKLKFKKASGVHLKINEDLAGKINNEIEGRWSEILETGSVNSNRDKAA